MQIVFRDSVFKLMQLLYTLNHRYRYSNILSAMLYRTLCIVRVILVLALPSSWIQHLSDLFFGCFLCPTREFFTHMETSPLPVKGCKFWQVYARHLWPLSSEDSLPCHIYCDTGHPLIMVIIGNQYVTLIADRLAVEMFLVPIMFLYLQYYSV